MADTFHIYIHRYQPLFNLLGPNENREEESLQEVMGQEKKEEALRMEGKKRKSRRRKIKNGRLRLHLCQRLINDRAIL